jgi:hypothetical protein
VQFHVYFQPLFQSATAGGRLLMGQGYVWGKNMAGTLTFCRKFFMMGLQKRLEK